MQYDTASATMIFVSSIASYAMPALYAMPAAASRATPTQAGFFGSSSPTGSHKPCSEFACTGDSRRPAVCLLTGSSVFDAAWVREASSRRLLALRIVRWQWLVVG